MNKKLKIGIIIAVIVVVGALAALFSNPDLFEGSSFKKFRSIPKRDHSREDVPPMGGAYSDGMGQSRTGYDTGSEPAGGAPYVLDDIAASLAASLHPSDADGNVRATVSWLLTQHDETRYPCLARIVTDNNTAFNAYPSYPREGTVLQETSPAVVCDVLADALAGNKQLIMGGDIVYDNGIPRRAESGEYSLAINYVNIIAGNDLPTADRIPERVCQSPRSCGGTGQVVRVLSWQAGVTTLCNAILREDDQNVSLYVRQPQPDPNHKTVLSMFEMCDSLSNAVVSGKTVTYRGSETDGGRGVMIERLYVGLN